MNPIQIKLPLNISYPSVNAYLFPGPTPTLVDCGMNTPEVIHTLDKALATHGLGLADIRKVVITHPHVDHIGLAGVLAQKGAEIWLSDLAADWMDHLEAYRVDALKLLLELMSQYGFDAASIQMTDQFYRGLSSMFTEIPDVNRRTFKAGDQIEIGEQNYRVISAPGHSNRQVCFYQAEDERLLSADMLLPKTPVPLVETRLDGSNQRELGLKMMLESFNTFEQLKVRQVYPGHGSPFSDHTTLIQTQVARIHRRKSECLSLIRSGVDTLPELLKKMYRKMPVQARLSGLAMLIGYLDLLLADQKITKIEINGQHKYRPSRIP